jgi:hypothetical protein
MHRRAKQTMPREETGMEVHAPHHPISSWRDFFLHLITITIGLLIAVGIEGLVGLHREHSLVKEARSTLREEIAYNANEMAGSLPDIDAEKTALTNNIGVLTALAEHPADPASQHGKIDAHIATVSLHSTAWKTAQTTGALAYMPYEEAQRYADIYATQEDFLAQQTRLIDDQAQFLGVAARSTPVGGGMSREQADMALQTLGAWRLHLYYLGAMAQLTSMSDKAFLEGKEAPGGISVELKGGDKPK